MKFIVGTRGSKLALTQTQMVIDILKNLDLGHEYVVKIITTKGDQNYNVPLSQVGGSGIFVKEIEQELLNRSVDFAVHSLKDMPSILAQGLVLGNFLLREEPGDVLITKSSIHSIADIPQGAIIGTGSLRRQCQLRSIRPDFIFEPIRGNIDSRIKKIGDTVDAVVLARSGINRLGVRHLDGYHIYDIPIEQMIPSPCQGILGIEMRENGQHKEVLSELLDQLKDDNTCLQAELERVFLKEIGSNCHIPIGGFCEITSDEICFHALLGSGNGDDYVRKSVLSSKNDIVERVRQLAQDLMKEVGL